MYIYFFFRDTITDLNKGAEYYFRVKAKNLIGFGEPTQTAHAVAAREEIIMPDVDLHDLYMGSVSTKAGTNLTVKVPIIGNCIFFTFWLNLKIVEKNLFVFFIFLFKNQYVSKVMFNFLIYEQIYFKLEVSILCDTLFFISYFKCKTLGLLFFDPVHFARHVSP